MTANEIALFNKLEGAFRVKPSELADYVIGIELYYADETDNLAVENSTLTDYLDEALPDLTAEEYDDTKQAQWLGWLRRVINHAKTLATE